MLKTIKINQDETTKDMTDETPKTVSPEKLPPHKRRFFKYKIFGAAVLIVGIVLGVFFYNQYTKTPAYAQKKADREAVVLVEKVSKHMILPEGKPAIFVVSDPDMLIGQQAFFKDSEKGDSLLVYSESGKAIIYSAKRDLIVNVGPVTFDQEEIKSAPVIPTANNSKSSSER